MTATFTAIWTGSYRRRERYLTSTLARLQLKVNRATLSCCWRTQAALYVNGKFIYVRDPYKFRHSEDAGIGNGDFTIYTRQLRYIAI